MCGRIFIQPSSKLNELLSGLGLNDAVLPHLNNLAPTDAVPVIRHSPSGKLELKPMRWWLHPYWLKEGSKQRFSTFNARIETVQTHASFRVPIRHRRAIVPASAFVEWKTEGKHKQPFLIEGAEEPLALAAIWDLWQNDLYSCAIFTQPANESFSQIHDRMPLALTIEQANEWLNPHANTAVLINELRGACVVLKTRKINAAVNNARCKEEAVFVE